MENPLIVVSPDISNKESPTNMYIDGSKVIAAYSCYVIKETDGFFGMCTADNLGGQFSGYKLKYFDGTIYFCGNDFELRKIGLSMNPSFEQPPTNPMGFFSDDE